MPIAQVLDSTFISKALEDIMEYQLFALNTQNPYEYFNCKTHCYRCSEWTTENWKLLITQFSEMVNQTLVKFPARQSRNFLSCYTILHALYIKTVKKHALHLCEPKEGSRLRGLTFHLLSTGTVLSDACHSTVLWDTLPTNSQSWLPIAEIVPFLSVFRKHPHRFPRCLRGGATICWDSLNPKTSKWE